jgi:hypothetical protein
MKTADKSKPESRPVRLPGFLNEKDIGMGDVIKRATSYVGIKPCGGCEARAAALNGRFVFSADSRNQRKPSSPR